MSPLKGIQLIKRFFNNLCLLYGKSKGKKDERKIKIVSYEHSIVIFYLDVCSFSKRNNIILLLIYNIYIVRA